MLNMSIGEVIKVIDASTAAEDAVVDLVDNLREAFRTWVWTYTLTQEVSEMTGFTCFLGKYHLRSIMSNIISTFLL